MVEMVEREMKYYKSGDGEYIALCGTFGESLFHSPDGMNFFELKRTGFGGTSKEYKLSFEDPHQKSSGEFQFANKQVKWGEKIFHETFSPTGITKIPLPTVRILEYLFSSADGKLFYVSADKYYYSYESFRLFVGDADNMKEIKILGVRRCRDGGTTWIETEEGVLFSPTPFQKEKFPTWADVPLERLDPKGYQISETRDGVKITKL